LGDSLTTALLILHSLLAVALLGAITHQAIAAVRSGSADGKKTFGSRYRAVDASAYAGAIVVLFAAASLIGAVLYPSYRMIVRPVLELNDLRVANGTFELKEHFAAVGLLMLPAYWAAWRKPLAPEHAAARMSMTWLLAAIVWWNFIVGDVLNNIRGLSH
jgi:hypothetical protein